MNRFVTILTLVAAGGAAVLPCAADSLGTPVYNATVYPFISLHQAGTISYGGTVATVGTAQGPLVDLVAVVDSGHRFAAANGSVSYSFEFTGADGPIPVNYSLHLLTSFTTGNSSFNTNDVGAEFDIDDGFNTVDRVCFGSGLPGGCPQSPGEFLGSRSLTLNANQIYHVYLGASLSATNLGDAIAHAVIDGVSFSVGSSFGDGSPFSGNPSSYSLNLSSGIGNSVSGTPEPASFVLVLTGLVGIVFKKRARPAKLLAIATWWF